MKFDFEGWSKSHIFNLMYFICISYFEKCRTEHYRLRHVEDSERGRGDQQVVYLLSLVTQFKLGF